MLVATSQIGDRSAIDCLLAGLQTSKLYIHSVCLSALHKTTPRGHALATLALMGYLTQRRLPGVQFGYSTTTGDECKHHAYRALARIASNDNESAISLMRDKVLFTYVEETGRDWSEERQHMPVVDGLVELGQVGHPDLIESLLKKLGRDRMDASHYRLCVLRALAKLTNKGNAKVIKALLRFLPGFHCVEGLDFSASFEAAVCKTLEQVVEPCDQGCVEHLAGLLADPHEWQDAIEAVDRATHGEHVQGILDALATPPWLRISDSSGHEGDCPSARGTSCSPSSDDSGVSNTYSAHSSRRPTFRRPSSTTAATPSGSTRLASQPMVMKRPSAGKPNASPGGQTRTRSKILKRPSGAAGSPCPR